MRKRTLAVALASFFLFGLTTALFAGGQKEGSATSSSSTMSSTASSVPQGGEILGAGSSFAFPIYSKMGDEYNKITGAKLNYQSIGSSGGIKNITNKVVDFGASDAFLDDSQISAMPAPIIQYPTVAGAIVITYNLPGNPTLKLTGDTIAKIWLGQITKWNDPAIAATNPGVTLPSQDIVVAHRSDGSGTTFNFTLYLSRVNGDWQSKVGYNTSVNWPVGLGGAQNAGVAGIVSQTPGAIGYVELAYATQNNLPFATLQNKAGNWIVPSLASTSAAANTQIPADGRIYLDNTDAPQGYPITTLTWIIVYKEQNYSGRTLEQAQRLANFLWWTVHDGQQYAEPLQYSKLPAAAVTADENIIKSMTYDGKPILNK
jgi:phosphate transport system substrate-binding protein